MVKEGYAYMTEECDDSSDPNGLKSVMTLLIPMTLSHIRVCLIARKLL